MTSQTRVAVVGSSNMDLVIRCGTMPLAGETQIAESMTEICGGKGANQAVAAARLGAEVALIARVGSDGFADRMLDNLNRQHIDTRRVLRTAGSASGLAVIAVDRTGQNSIIVVPGANAQLSVDDVQAARQVIESSDVLLLQMEVPLATIQAATEIAAAAGTRIILDPAPAPRQGFTPELAAMLLQIDLICPNQTESATLVGHPLDSKSAITKAAKTIRQHGARNVAITLGSKGTYLLSDEGAQLLPALPIRAVDSTAAGDAFAAALAVVWQQSQDLPAAVRFANAAGAWAATRHGAQPSLGTRAEIESLISQSPQQR